MGRAKQPALDGLTYAQRRSLQSKATKSEKQEQVEVIKWARSLSAIFPELRLLRGDISGVYLPGYLAASAKAAGCAKGTPDLCLAIARKGYHHLYIEQKCRKDGSHVRDYQQEYMDMLARQGNLCLVGWDARDTITKIADYLDLPDWVIPDESGRITVPPEHTGQVVL